MSKCDHCMCDLVGKSGVCFEDGSESYCSSCAKKFPELENYIKLGQAYYTDWECESGDEWTYQEDMARKIAVSLIDEGLTDENDSRQNIIECIMEIVLDNTSLSPVLREIEKDYNLESGELDRYNKYKESENNEMP